MHEYQQPLFWTTGIAMHKRWQLWWAIVGCLLLLPGLARARTLVVERDGSGEYTVIQDALDVAAPGDTVLIGPGRYDDFRVHTFGTGGIGAIIMIPTVSPLTIVGTDWDSVIVGPEVVTPKFQDYQTVCIAQDGFPENGIEIRGISFERTAVIAAVWEPQTFAGCRFRFMASSAIQLVNAPDLHVLDCEFESSPEVGWVDGILGFVGGHNPGLVVRNCTFRHQISTCIQPTGATDFEISGCYFEDIGVAVALYYESTGFIRDCVVGPSVPDCARIQISSGSVVDLENLRLSESATQFGILDKGTQVTGRNLVLTGGTFYTVLVAAGASLTLRDCDILNGGGQGTVQSTNLTTTDGVVDLRECYWGTTDSTQIAQWIYDGNEDPLFTKVEYLPFRANSVPTESKSVGGFKALFRR